MFDTYVTIVGNVLTAPEWRRTAQSNTLVANFKVASTARRLNRDSGRWVDGNAPCTGQLLAQAGRGHGPR